ncbi:Transposon Ty3-I Gag-Pol poly, partial [Paramuricea clavata]
MAERNTQEFHPNTSASGFNEGTVSKIESKRNDEQVCYRCGGNYTAKTCRFKTAKCFKCTKTCHIASVCRSKTSKEVKPGATSKHGQAGRGNIQSLSLYDSNNDNVDSDELGIYSLYSGLCRRNKFVNYIKFACIHKTKVSSIRWRVNYTPRFTTSSSCFHLNELVTEALDIIGKLNKQ